MRQFIYVCFHVVFSSYERSKHAEAPLNTSQLLPVMIKDEPAN